MGLSLQYLALLPPIGRAQTGEARAITAGFRVSASETIACKLSAKFLKTTRNIAVADGVEGRIFWFDENGIHVERNQMMAAARASVESICRPGMNTRL